MFEDGACALVECLNLIILALKKGEHGQVIERNAHVRMMGPEHLLLDGQGTLVEWFGLLMFAPVEVEQSQVAEALSDIGVMRFERLFTDRQRTLVEWLDFHKLATLVQIIACSM